MASDWQAGLSAQDQTAVASQPPPAPLSRADIADYLDRANYDPEQARALAAKERLSNLGVAPQVIAQATAPPTPWMASAHPRPAPVAVPRPSVPIARAATPQIDLSAAFVPKGNETQAKGGDIDLSAARVGRA
jgi:hypothetical protein